MAVADRPTAVICSNDAVAIGALNAARGLGIRVPEDVSVVGFDDLPMAAWEVFQLTTVRQPIQDMAREAARLSDRADRGACRPARVVPDDVRTGADHARHARPTVVTRFVVLDDDPTGTQEVTGVTACFRGSSRVMASAVDARREAIHVVTNSRAMSAVDAEQRRPPPRCRSARSHSPGCELILRGDSTLRGHVFEEYRAACQVTDTGHGAAPVWFPPCPSAGRVTIDGMHTIEATGAKVPASRNTLLAGRRVLRIGQLGCVSGPRNDPVDSLRPRSWNRDPSLRAPKLAARRR